MEAICFAYAAIAEDEARVVRAIAGSSPATLAAEFSGDRARHPP